MIYTNGSTYLLNFPAINFSLRFEQLFPSGKGFGPRGVANTGARDSEQINVDNINNSGNTNGISTSIQNLLCLGSPQLETRGKTRSRRIRTSISEEQHA